MDNIEKMFAIFMIIMCSFCAYLLIAVVGTGEDIVIEGKITNVDVVTNEDGNIIEYFTIYLDNESCNVYPYKYKELDFTINSKFVINLGRSTPRFPVFMRNDIYNIKSITKIPGD